MGLGISVPPGLAQKHSASFHSSAPLRQMSSVYSGDCFWNWGWTLCGPFLIALRLPLAGIYKIHRTALVSHAEAEHSALGAGKGGPVWEQCNPGVGIRKISVIILDNSGTR